LHTYYVGRSPSVQKIGKNAKIYSYLFGTYAKRVLGYFFLPKIPVIFSNLAKVAGKNRI
jgi:hypothetical protein